MVEVTIELDEDMTRDDPSIELLPEPEPVLMIMSPPPPFLPVPGEPTMLWDRWKNSFEQYLEALGEPDLTDSVKCELLQHCLGHEGQRVYAERVRGKATYAAAIFALTTHFKSCHNSQTYPLEFQQREQRPGESVEDFVSALKEMLRPCTFGNLKDELVLQQLIKKTNCKQLRERLMSEEKTLTLANALTIGKQIEYSLAESALPCTEIVTMDSSDTEDHTVKLLARRRTQRYEESETIKPYISPCFSDCIKDDDSIDKQGHSGNEYETDNKCNEFGTAANHKYNTRSRRNGASGAMIEDGSHDVSEDHNETKTDETIIFKAKKNGSICPICTNRSFRNAYKLARHMRTHTKDKPFSCHVCNMTFSQSYHMTRHLRNQHGAGRYVCYKCGKDFSSSTELKTHRNIHVQEVLSHPDHDKKPQEQSLLFNQIEPHSKGLSKQTKSHKFRVCDGLRKLESHNKYNAHTTDKHYSGDGNEIVSGNVVNCDVNSCRSAVNISCDEVEYHDGDKSEDVIAKTKTKGNTCHICINRSFINAYHLARHMRMHTKVKPFSCSVCTMTFSQSYHMIRHLRNQHGAGQYICNKCGKVFSGSAELKTHKEMHVQEELSCPESDKLPPQGLDCTECGKKFTRKYHLKRHIAIHNKSTEKECYKCPDCPKTYTFMKHLKKHLEKHQKEKNGTCLGSDQTSFCPEALETQLDILENSNVCKKCSRKFVDENALKKHKEERFYCSMCDKHFCKMSHYKRHSTAHFRRESKCPHCESVFLKLVSLKNHLRTHSEERPYQCPCCVECFSQKEDLEYHCLKHRRLKKEKPYSCTRCDHAFVSLMELTTHMRSHKGEQPVNCPECGKMFLNRSKLRRHMSIHTGERPHLCATCGHGFPSAAGLKMHMYSHTGERPFKCSLCSKSYRTSSGLRLHSRHHMGVKSRYPCPDCGRTYGRMTELRMHQRYHTGDKPHSCTCCNKSFISKHKLNVHMRIHTGERPYSCSQCGQTFTQAGDRNRHMSKCH